MPAHVGTHGEVCACAHTATVASSVVRMALEPAPEYALGQALGLNIYM